MFYQTLKRRYIFAFIVMLMLFRAVPVATALPSFISKIIYAAMAFFGVVIIIFNAVYQPIDFLRPTRLLLIGFLVICMVSSIANRVYASLFDNAKGVAWMAVYFFVVFGFGSGMRFSQKLLQLRCFANTVICISLVQSAAGLVEFFSGVGYVTELDSVVKHQGFIENRLFGVYTDPNYAAVISAICIFLSLLLFKNAKRPMRVVYLLSIVVEYCYIVLSGSRTAILVGAAATVLSAFFILREKITLRYKQLSAALAAVIICALFLCLNTAVTAGFSSLGGEIYGSVGNTLERTDVAENSDISNSRFKIWKTGAVIFMQNPLIGVSPRGINEYCRVNLPNSIIVSGAKKYTTVHSVAVQLPASTGIAGTVVMVAFAVVYTVRLFRIRKLAGKRRRLLFGCIIIMIMILIEALLCLDILFVSLPSTLVFWCAAGAADSLCETEALR